MNEAEKIVFSETLKKARWNNTRIIRKKIEKAVSELKNQPGKNMIILGSGTIVAKLTKKGLIDDYQIMVCPVVLGKGSSMFKSVKKLNLKLTKTKTFKSGNILLVYEPNS